MSIQYPIKFTPILKPKIWGGEKLRTLLHKASEGTDIGESWELSGIKGNTSVVANGPLQGESLTTLIERYTVNLLGQSVYERFGNKFPLLIKFIDAKEALSIQLHPNDTLAKERHNAFGKTEMWYIVDVEPGGSLVVGFKKPTDRMTYLKHVEDKKLLDLLNVEEVQPGQVYFIPTGRIHAIGAGVLLAEIQQTSDITYRIYDWDRKDAHGNERELHTDLALEAIDYGVEKRYDTPYEKIRNKSSEIIDCQYFTTNIIPFDERVNFNHDDKDSFVIYLCVNGALTIHYGDGETEHLQKGETILMPASLKTFSFVPQGLTEVLEVYIRN
ncbi:class I mannose-6-phosphate isomerase [Flavobacteriaceae bacterium F08102]|nr:class I mannose-6-phosphate isomerase [Flavobacteriaceae bacterium F08102]